MSNHPRKLFVLTLAACVAPVSGAQAPALAEPLIQDSDCPYARAEIAAAQREAGSGTVVASTAAVSMFEGAPGLVP